MVSDAALGFVTGFMGSSYVEGLRFKQTALAKAQVQRELREEENNAMINDMFAISKTMQNATEEEKDTLRNRLNKFSPTGLQKISTLQMTGGDMFIKQEGSYGIKPLTTSNPTEGDKQRDAYNTVVGILSQTTGETPEETRKARMKAFNQVDLKDMQLAREYLYGKGKNESTRYGYAERMNLIYDPAKEKGLDVKYQGTYRINEDNELAKEILSSKGMKMSDPFAISSLVNSDIVNERIMVAMLGAYQGRDDGRTRAILADSERVSNAQRKIIEEGIDSKIYPEDTSTPVSSTQIMSTETTRKVYGYNQNWFENNIAGAFSQQYTRQTMLKKLTDDRVAEGIASGGISSANEQQAREAIYAYLSEQFDLASEAMSQ